MGEPIFNHENLEKNPTEAEVLRLFNQLIEEGQNFETERKVEDSKGLYLWTIKIMNEEDSGYTAYEYVRKGRYEKSDKHGNIQSLETSIHVAYFDEDDFPLGGEMKATYLDGEWVTS